MVGEVYTSEPTSRVSYIVHYNVRYLAYASSTNSTRNSSLPVKRNVFSVVVTVKISLARKRTISSVSSSSSVTDYTEVSGSNSGVDSVVLTVRNELVGVT